MTGPGISEPEGGTRHCRLVGFAKGPSIIGFIYFTQGHWAFDMTVRDTQTDTSEEAEEGAVVATE